MARKKMDEMTLLREKALESGKIVITKTKIEYERAATTTTGKMRWKLLIN